MSNLRTLSCLAFLCAAPLGCGDSESNTPAPDLLGPSVTILTGGDCPAPTGAGTEHSGVISADETWTAAQSPHIVKFGVDVRGATLTLEPCAVVRVKTGYSITVGGSPGSPAAALIAAGSSSGSSLRPVVIKADDDTKFWGSLQILATGTADLSVLVMQRGGNPGTAPGGGGALVIWGDDNRKIPGTSVRARGVLIEEPAGPGIQLSRSGGFTADSSDVAVQNAGKSVSGGGNPADMVYPIVVDVPSVQTIPPGTYTGNARDLIYVVNGTLVGGDETFHDRGVPYRIRDELSIKPMLPASQGGLSTFTIDPGVTITIVNQAGNTKAINLGVSSGPTPDSLWPTRLIAAGTAEKPIRITSDNQVPASGDWGAIEWGGGPATGNVMSYVTVEYGGAPSGTANFGCGPKTNDALFIITNWQPADAFVQNCTFAHSASGGIVSGWYSDTPGPNLKPGNTFIDIAKPCEVSLPKTANGGCPSAGATPDCY